ncbi:hypothetical protein C7Y66_04655 [Chroococcidiopsis sp. CCALA 051]|nr:hypothetical protein C7Y66_04655 [Chroococcidiopsis sp. CCALA 051]
MLLLSISPCLLECVYRERRYEFQFASFKIIFQAKITKLRKKLEFVDVNSSSKLKLEIVSALQKFTKIQIL